MSRDFEWRTEEDQEWEDSPTLLEPHQKKIPELGLKTWLILLVIMIAIAGLHYRFQEFAFALNDLES